MRQFYSLGWCPGTGGGISIRDGDTIYLSPSGVQKERLRPEQMFAIDSSTFEFRPLSEQNPATSSMKPSQCWHLFELAFKFRNAGAVVHSHGIETVLAGKLFEGQPTFVVKDLEMIKGLRNGEGKAYQNDEVLAIPIIENTRREGDLVVSMQAAMLAYPDAPAVLVRNHGLYVWGKDWKEAKCQAECLHYLMKLLCEMQKLMPVINVDNKLDKESKID